MFSQNINADFGKAIVTNIENWKCYKNGKKCVGKGKVFSALLTDVSKAFDCFDHKITHRQIEYLQL